MIEQNKKVIINYTNRKHDTRDRVVVPKNIWYGVSKWYDNGDQWFLTAYDLDKEEDREFALLGINKIRQFSELLDNGPSAVAEGNFGEVKLFTDGGSRGNPGQSAIGYVLFDMEDQVLLKKSKYIGITTNNQAEYQGLKEGLEYCSKMNVHTVHIYMDSLLVVNQIKGIFKVKNRDLWPAYESVKEQLSHFKHFTISHVPRELNKIADGMVNECLDTESQ